jgi:DnaJ-class molecular chaperone
MDERTVRDQRETLQQEAAAGQSDTPRLNPDSAGEDVCPTCGGSGFLDAGARCADCRGTGIVDELDSVDA